MEVGIASLRENHAQSKRAKQVNHFLNHSLLKFLMVSFKMPPIFTFAQVVYNPSLL
jgi:hypothetical protein